mgnify:CR=1 FL=1
MFSMNLEEKIGKVINLNPAMFNYRPYNRYWFKDTYPNLDDRMYDILAKSANSKEKIIDLRRETLKVNPPKTKPLSPKLQFSLDDIKYLDKTMDGLTLDEQSNKYYVNDV